MQNSILFWSINIRSFIHSLVSFYTSLSLDFLTRLLSFTKHVDSPDEAAFFVITHQGLLAIFHAFCCCQLFIWVSFQVGPARFRAPELLFRPDLIGEEFEGLHEVRWILKRSSQFILDFSIVSMQ